MDIGDIDLLRTYLQKQLNVFDLNRDNAAGFIAIIARFGWQPFTEAVRPLFDPAIGRTAMVGCTATRQRAAFQRRPVDTIMQTFVDDVRQRLQTAFPTPPDQPTDWSHARQLGCHCEFCTQVN